MKINYNFGILKNTRIGFSFFIDDKKITFEKDVLNIKNTKDEIIFNLSDGKFVIKEIKFIHMKIELINNVIYFIEQDNNFISGLFGFSMFDTYGFPVEITEEMLQDEGFILDVNGFNILRERQKQLNKGTFKSDSAFK